MRLLGYIAKLLAAITVTHTPMVNTARYLIKRPVVLVLALLVDFSHFLNESNKHKVSPQTYGGLTHLSDEVGASSLAPEASPPLDASSPTPAAFSSEAAASSPVLAAAEKTTVLYGISGSRRTGELDAAGRSRIL